MAMIYGLVKQHGGFVHVYSEPGKGTEVKLHFPVVESEASAGTSTQADQESLPVGSELIMVVEDEDAIRRATKRTLEAHGYTVLTAADGEEALEAFGVRGSKIDLVVSDMMMPKMGGRELQEALIERGENVMFLFTSGYSAEEMHEGAALRPGTHLLQKPWTLAELLGKVREVLDGVELVGG
jgi:CheY-like chemotaxis protein